MNNMKKKCALVLGQFRLPKALRSWLSRASDGLRFLCSSGKPMLKEEKISLLVLIIVAGFSIAVAYHYVMGYYLSKPWPASTFLHIPGARFFDFDKVVRQSAALDPFGEDIGGFAGAPFAQFVGYLFSLIRPALLRLPIFFGSFFVVFILMVKHHLYSLKSKLTSYQLLAIFAIVFLTYPVLFAVDRANFDLLVVLCLFLFAFTYERRKYKASTVFLALAIALKPYAAIFIIVYALDKKFKDGLLVIFNAVFLTVLSLSLFKDGLFAETQKYFHALFNTVDYLSVGNQQAFTSDLYGLLTVGMKFIGDRLGTTIYLPAHPEARILYAIVAIIVFIYFVIYLWEKPKPLWKTIAVLTILIVLLPYNSADYRLTYLFVPMLMYMAINEKTRNDLLIIILWGLLLVPKNYIALVSPQNIGMIINPLLLIGLLICVIPGAFSISGIKSTLRFIYRRSISIFPICNTKVL
ncbi:MAG: glycosyltransferase 87 family protein [Chloroflexi bacterium]|nr:glycosyltransferase 87 family protein [Chloroflexota bacterium]